MSDDAAPGSARRIPLQLAGDCVVASIQVDLDEPTIQVVNAVTDEIEFGIALDGHRVRPMAKRDVQHFVGHRHFQIQRSVALLQQIGQAFDIGVGNVPAVFAQMCGDAVAAGGDARARDPEHAVIGARREEQPRERMPQQIGRAHV